MSKIYTSDVSSANVVSFTFLGEAFQADGVVNTIEVDVSQLSQEMLLKAACHGIKQKIADAAAMSRDTETGKSASDTEKFTKMARVADTITAGQWELPREGGSGAPAGGLLAKAIAEVRGKDVTKVAAWLKTQPAGHKAALAADKAIKKVIDRMTAERVKAMGVDTGSLLAGLDD